MFSFLSNLTFAFTLITLTLSWISGSRATRLINGGSVERLNRKVRKQMVWAAYVTLPGILFIIITFQIVQSMDTIFWEDRLLIHLPLILIPLLSIWLLSVPRLWKLWQATLRTSGAPLPVDLRKQAAHPLIIVPFRMSALGAVTLFYFLLITPDPLHFAKAFVPIILWIAATAAIWYTHDRRWQKMSQPEVVLVNRPWRRRLRAFSIFSIAVGLAGIALFIENRNSKLPVVMNMSEGAMDFSDGTVLEHNGNKDGVAGVK